MPKNNNIIAVIPARYQSERLPGKLLLDIGTKSILQHVYDNAIATDLFSEVIIACDKMMYEKIDWDGNKVLTRDDHDNGTSRIGEIALNHPADYIVNIQGDEPFINKELLEPLCKSLILGNNIVTLIAKMEKEENVFDFNTVKVVVDENGNALYFSRQAIPGFRDIPFREWQNRHDYMKHHGIYGFERKTLIELLDVSKGSLAETESLEQLNWMEKGYSISCVESTVKGFGIDTEDDLIAARRYYKTLPSKE